MSVIFTTITDSFIALCADRQSTNSETGEVQIDAITKINQWSPSIAVGHCGNKRLCDLLLSAVRADIKERRMSLYSAEFVADLICGYYLPAKEDDKGITDDIMSNFVIAGKLNNGKLGVVQISVGNGIAEKDVTQGEQDSVTIICAPEDLSSEDCRQLLEKAVLNTKVKNKLHRDVCETIHRKAVRYVSERSNLVSHRSDYLLIK